MPALKCAICGGNFENSPGEAHDACGACRGAASLGPTKTDARAGLRAAPADAVESLVANGKASLKLHNYDAAQKNFSRAVEEDPTDYRGWWGLILCATEALAKETGQWATLNTWFGHIRRLADAKTIAMLEKEYVEYAKKIADADALKDIETIGNIVRNAKANVRQYRERQTIALNEKAELEKNFETVSVEHDDRIKLAAENHARHEKRLKLSGLLNKIAVLLLISGLFLGLVHGLFIAAGFAFFLTIAVVDSMSLSKTARELGGASGSASRAVKSAVSGLKAISEKTKGDKAVDEKRIRERIAALDREMKFLNGEIAATEKRILPCEKYLALGKGRIASMFFVWRCSSFGVKIEVEDVKTVVRLRKEVWDERR